MKAERGRVRALLYEDDEAGAVTLVTGRSYWCCWLVELWEA